MIEQITRICIKELINLLKKSIGKEIYDLYEKKNVRSNKCLTICYFL